MPENCDLTHFQPKPTPATLCEDSYHQSQDIIKFTFSSVKEVSSTEDFIECVKTNMNKVVPSPTMMCFYVGFEPKNLVSLKEYEEEILSEGYRKNADGEYIKKTGTEVSRAEVARIKAQLEA